jgi:hypothetical protein
VGARVLRGGFAHRIFYSPFPSQSMRGVIQQLTGESATIRLDDGQAVLWPVRRLPAGATLGAVVELQLRVAERPADDHAETSRKHLNDILSSKADA